MTPLSAAPFALSGKTAFVTGAAGHLGSAMTRALCAAGAHVIVNGRDSEKLERFAKALKEDGYSVSCAEFDVTDLSCAATFLASQSRIDIIVNNAIDMKPASFDSLQTGAFEETYRSCVTAAFDIVRAALPALKAAVEKSGDASVINIASMYGAVAPNARIYAEPEQASPFHYGPAKAALLQLTRHLAAHLGGKKIRVNALVPGPFPNDVVRRKDPAFAERLGAKTMLGRVGNAEEIAGPLLFLASQASSFVTGIALPVDGGWTAW